MFVQVKLQLPQVANQVNSADGLHHVYSAASRVDVSDLYRYYRFGVVMTSHRIRLYDHFAFSLRVVEWLAFERDVVLICETVRCRCGSLGASTWYFSSVPVAAAAVDYGLGFERRLALLYGNLHTP